MPRRALRAKAFFTALDPVKALYRSAVLNGVVAVPVMGVMMHLSIRHGVMAGFTLPLPLKLFGWLATIVMAVTVLAMVVTRLA